MEEGKNVMIDIYTNIKGFLIGEDSFNKFKIGLASLFLIWIIFILIYKYCKKTKDSNYFIKYSYQIKDNCMKQFFMILPIFILFNDIDIFIDSAIYLVLKKYLFLIFILLSLRTLVNIDFSIRWHDDIGYIFELISSSNDISYDNMIKNKNELNCKDAITFYESNIKCTTLKLDILKHFVAPTILVSLLSYLNTFQTEKEIQALITDISIFGLATIVFIFWKNYKELKYNYKIVGRLESTLYSLKNKIEYTEDELRKLNEQRLKQPLFNIYKNNDL